MCRTLHVLFGFFFFCLQLGGQPNNNDCPPRPMLEGIVGSPRHLRPLLAWFSTIFFIFFGFYVCVAFCDFNLHRAYNKNNRSPSHSFCVQLDPTLTTFNITSGHRIWTSPYLAAQNPTCSKKVSHCCMEYNFDIMRHL